MSYKKELATKVGKNDNVFPMALVQKPLNWPPAGELWQLLDVNLIRFAEKQNDTLGHTVQSEVATSIGHLCRRAGEPGTPVSESV